MSEVKDVTIVIPAYNPDDKFVKFVQDLREHGYKSIIAVNDGSKDASKPYIKEAVDKFGIILVNHNVNLGQGRAYKSGLNAYLGLTDLDQSIGVIQCDCDGQHCVEDVNKVAELMRENRESFIVGTREFSDKTIPFRSRFGNNCTNFVFKHFVGLPLNDVMSGLKGLPKAFIYKLIEARGERFEFVTTTLLEVKKCNLDIIQIPIQTIYINGNETSHFRPVLDSVKIYKTILNYFLYALFAYVLSVLAFGLSIDIFKEIGMLASIIIASCLGKLVTDIYTLLINRNAILKNNAKTVKYIAFCILRAAIVTAFVFLIVNYIGINSVVCKIIVDLLLFIPGFKVFNGLVLKS